MAILCGFMCTKAHKQARTLISGAFVLQIVYIILGGETMYYLIIALSLVMAGELEVDGSLKVSEGIDAQGQAISNVGSAVLDSDATNLSTVRSMLGMKPTRIYTKVHSPGGSDQTTQYTVPSGKIWIPSWTGGGNISLAAIAQLPNDPGPYPIVFLPGMIVTVYTPAHQNGILTIHEYSISGSGTDQGLDYVEP